MKKLIAVASGIFLSLALHAQDMALPNTEIKNVSSGQKTTFDNTVSKGKVTLVSFWATWCVPCKKEIKNIKLKLNDWQKQADFNYMTVSIDESRAEPLVYSYAKSQGWNFPYYIDPNSDLKRSLNFQTVPYTIIIDKTGKVVYMHAGYEEGGEDEVFEEVKKYALK